MDIDERTAELLADKRTEDLLAGTSGSALVIVDSACVHIDTKC